MIKHVLKNRLLVICACVVIIAALLVTMYLMSRTDGIPSRGVFVFF